LLVRKQKQKQRRKTFLNKDGKEKTRRVEKWYKKKRKMKDSKAMEVELSDRL
jgi:hypothetical protein